MLSKWLLQAICKRSYTKFVAALSSPAAAQRAVLGRIVRDLVRTRYGAAHRISANDNYTEFAKKIPVRDYDQLEGWISLQLSSRGESILTPHAVVHVEPTSGSSGMRKSIPYTLPLLQSFTNMFAIWAYDILTHGPSFSSLRTFISVSEGGAGFASDRDYLRGPLRWLVGRHLVSKSSLADATDLEIISVWSPSYLLVLLEEIGKPRWPHLKFISCWGDSAAEEQFEKLRAHFPTVHFQKKGLLSTEAPITVPLLDIDGAMPVLNEVFLEFENTQGEFKLVHELQLGEKYQVIVSQSGGLTRYRTHDVVSVTGFYRGVPLLKFIGRANQVSDLVGEKLHAQFIQSTLRRLIPSQPFVLVPDYSGYVLLTETPVCATTADQLLCSAHHYALARELKQLSRLRNFIVDNLTATMHGFFCAQGMKRGDIKDTFLITDLRQAQKLLDFVGASECNFAPPQSATSAETLAFGQGLRPRFPSAVGS